ncbi:segregation and condensation protein A, partial [Lactiplantibacillus plantarum]
MTNNQQQPITIMISEFEGPLDLLLHLIRQNKMDIYDIPIAAITQQYLDYLHSMRALKLDIAGDYLVMAATLMTIKSRFLLPQPEPDEMDEDNEDDDPRDSLVA